MTWTDFWSDATNIATMIRQIAVSFPTMIIDVLFAGATLSALWAMVKMIREVRS